ncbi:MAG: biopolymer transporter ExbD [Pseudomonadota bacterium]
MGVRRPALPPRGEPVIVLVDIVFFLLVFFMLIARFDATAPFEISPPVATTGADMPGGGVTLAIAQDGALAIDGAPASDGAWLAEIEGALGGSETPLIRVNAHAAADLRHLLPRLAALEAAALGEVVLVVTPSAAP